MCVGFGTFWYRYEVRTKNMYDTPYDDITVPEYQTGTVPIPGRE